MKFTLANLYFVDGSRVSITGDLLKALYDGILKGGTTGIHLITDGSTNTTYNMANVIKIDWL
ncbi:hypothetical protein P4308_12060 [Bacillus wiedmannii]|uniref:hypothetical protein n=1 Tax=Bacillus cereus group TaxID=86661 RepID=UPI002DBFB87F|nr:MULTISPECIES: hypothetical protein [Bacillus cereus group]MEB9722636.1 hypothetical protein [Bacillus cereus]MED1407684.1 hypothetical protein [Bacillus mycoides]MED2932844.1 hypothetical protein [Bacillus wiedmannii]